MRKTTQANEATENRSAGVVTPGAPAVIGPGVIGSLLRLVWLRPRLAGRDAGDVIAARKRADQGYDAARSSMEAGLTRGASLLVGSRR